MFPLCRFALLQIDWTVKISVTPEDVLYSEGIRFWPSRVTLANYQSVLKASDFPATSSTHDRFVFDRHHVTAVASFAGYALSRFRFPGKNG